jgi:hypothetical protein
MKSLEGILVHWFGREYLLKQKILFDEEVEKIPKWYRDRYVVYLNRHAKESWIRLHTLEYLEAHELELRIQRRRRQGRIDLISLLLTLILGVLFTILVIYVMVLMGRKD